MRQPNPEALTYISNWDSHKNYVTATERLIFTKSQTIVPPKKLTDNCYYSWSLAEISLLVICNYSFLLLWISHYYYRGHPKLETSVVIDVVKTALVSHQNHFCLFADMILKLIINGIYQTKTLQLYTYI